MISDGGQVFLDGRVTLHAGDCLAVIKTLPDNSIDACVTDPPYALVSIGKRFSADNAAPCKLGKTGAYARASAGFMGKKWDTGETAFAVEFWREIFRVLKPGAHVVAFGGTRSYHRLACAIEDAGFEIRDQIKFDHDSEGEAIAFLDSLTDEQQAQFVKLCERDGTGQLAWAYGSGFPKSHDVSKGIDKSAGHWRGRAGAITIAEQPAKGTEYERTDKGSPVTAAAAAWEGWGTALKPAWEPICLARKPLSEKSVAANVLRWGTGAINVDACRVEIDPSVDDPRLGGQGDWSSDKMAKNVYEGCYAGVRVSSSPKGRWPANIVHDGSAEVLAAFPDSGPSKAADRGVDYLQADKESGWARPAHEKYTPSIRGHDDAGGSAARFFYSAKADADDRLGSKHPTVKPVDLMQWLCRLVCPPGGQILDPFAGTGTTGEAAWREGFNAVLIEREAEYQGDIARRMSLCLSGPATRSAESAKARYADKPVDNGPLFGGTGLAGGADRFTADSQTKNRTDRA